MLIGISSVESQLDGVPGAFQLGREYVNLLTNADLDEMPPVAWSFEVGEDLVPDPNRQFTPNADFHPLKFLKGAMEMEDGVVADEFRLFQVADLQLFWSKLRKSQGDQDERSLAFFLYFDCHAGDCTLNPGYLNSNTLSLLNQAFAKRWDYPSLECSAVDKPERQYQIELGLDGKEVPENPVILAFDGSSPGNAEGRYHELFEYYSSVQAQLRTLASVSDEDEQWQAFLANFDASWREDIKGVISGDGSVQALGQDFNRLGVDMSPVFVVDADPLFLVVTPAWDDSANSDGFGFVVLEQRGQSFRFIDKRTSRLSNLASLFRRDDFRSQFRAILDSEAKLSQE
jgi:hypothetical protein